jgi:predicted GH43/DUF377 family glycosyl hydrolase
MGKVKLKRQNGAILEPIPDHLWESQAVFNPATVRDGTIIHMLYRAVKVKNYSTIGYASLNSAGEILKRCAQPVIAPELAIEKQGCEDPRIVYLNSKYYIFYTAFDGQDLIKNANTRVMLAVTEDFQKYKKIGMIGPDVQDKDAMVFPAKIQNKIYYIHRIHPNIQLAIFECMEELIHPEGNYWEDHLKNLNKYTLFQPEYEWEALKVGAGPPPLLTDAGWLLIYHGVDNSRVYRAGAVLLSEKDPTKVIARLPYPILEPEREYERIGDVNMVVFPEGLVQIGDEILIFYGAADKVIGLASCRLSDLIEELWSNRIS